MKKVEKGQSIESEEIGFFKDPQIGLAGKFAIGSGFDKQKFGLESCCQP